MLVITPFGLEKAHPDEIPTFPFDLDDLPQQALLNKPNFLVDPDGRRVEPIHLQVQTAKPKLRKRQAHHLLDHSVPVSATSLLGGNEHTADRGCTVFLTDPIEFNVADGLVGSGFNRREDGARWRRSYGISEVLGQLRMVQREMEAPRAPLDEESRRVDPVDEATEIVGRELAQ
jgi:hypothetical protein